MLHAEFSNCNLKHRQNLWIHIVCDMENFSGAPKNINEYDKVFYDLLMKYFTAFFS